MTKYLTRTLLLGALLCAAPVRAAIFGDGYGVNVKTERVTPVELARIRALGIKRVRIGISWYAVEQSPSNYRWDLPLDRRQDADDYATRRRYTYDEIIAEIVRAGLKVDVTLHEGNAGLLGLVNVAAPGAEPSWRHVAPSTPEARRLFANFAAATVTHYEKLYGKSTLRWHIWNEPDTDGGFPPKTSGTVVGQLVTETCRAIRAVSPTAVVMGPALGAYGDGDLRYNFITDMFKTDNPLTCLTALTIHPYRSAPPETAAVDYNRITELLRPWQPAGRTVPVAVDEWGYSTNKNTWDIPTQRWRDRTDREQGDLVLRTYLTNMMAGLPLTVTYDWRDNGTEPTEWEHHFGLTDYDGHDKDTARVVGYTWSVLMGRPLTWLSWPTGCTGVVRAVRFGEPPTGKTGDEWTVVWRETGTEALAVSGRLLDVRGTLGEPRDTLTVSGSPMLLKHPTGDRPKITCVGGK